MVPTSLPAPRRLDGEVLRESRSGQVCLTCRWFAHEVPPDGPPVLICRLHRGQLAHGDHLLRRCQGWSAAWERPWTRAWGPLSSAPTRLG